MRLASVRIDWSTCVANFLHEVDELAFLPLKGVVVIVDEDGVGPAFVCQFKRLHNPVVASYSVTTQRIFVGCRSMTGYSLVHHIDEVDGGIMFLDGIEPLHDGLILLCRGEIVHP